MSDPPGRDDIELQSHQYSWRDKRTGRMVRDVSPGWARNWMFVALLMLSWVWWHRLELAPDTLFASAVFCAFGAGAFAANWLKTPWTWLRNFPKRWAAVVCVAFAVLLISDWSTHTQGSIDELFWSTAVLAFLCGAGAGVWTRDIY